MTTTRARTRRTLALPALLLLVACGGEGADHDGAADAVSPTLGDAPTAGTAPSEVWFEEQDPLPFRHVSGADGRFLMPEIMGGGGALADLDDDGRLDLYLVQGGRMDGPRDEQPGNALFLQRTPTADGSLVFEDVSVDSGADHRGYGMGAAAGDADGDGDSDLYVTNVGPDVLLRNQGDARFDDVSTATGAATDGWGTSTTFVDVDADGDLDLFVVRYLVWSAAGELSCHGTHGGRDYCSPQNYSAPARDVLLRNAGDGTFEDVSVTSGIASVPGTGLGVGAGDLDGDGDADLFVANDGMPDALWINDGSGRFEDDALLAGCAVDYGGRAKAGMGVALADVDRDADLDVVVCNLDQQSDSYFVNDGAGVFRDQTAQAGLAITSQPFTRFGMGLRDFDGDGWLDLYQANGRVTIGDRAGDDPFAEPDLLQRGVPGPDGAPRFEPVDTPDGTADAPAFTSRAALFGDLDDDGGVDVVVMHRDAPVRVLRNVIAAERGGHWLGLDLRDAHGAAALGARVTLRAGGRTWIVDARAGSSYLASSDPRVHVGLGDVERIDGLSVRWADGTTETFDTPALDAWHTLRRGSGR